MKKRRPKRKDNPGRDSSSPKAKAKSEKQKPRVKSFLRKASAIIASERGLNANAQQKLQTLAEYLKMPQDEFHEALALLQENEKLPAGLNRYEKDFVKFLKNELEQLNSGILTVSMENKAVDLAARKYQILEARARKLIHDQAEAMGVRGISRNEAEGYVEQLIANRIGDATSVDEPARNRFYKIGQKWGVSNEQVDAIILQTLSDNRRIESDAHRPTGQSWVVFILALLLVGTGIVFAVYSGLGNGDPVVVDPQPDRPPERNEDWSVTYPEWWDNDSMSVTVSRLLSDTDHQTWVEQLTSENPKTQVEGLERLIGLVSKSMEADSHGTNTDLQSVLAGYYYLCPDESVVQAMLDQLKSDLVLPASRVPAKMPKFESIYRANETLGYLRFVSLRGDSDQIQNRRDSLGDLVQREFGGGESAQDLETYLQLTNRVIAINQWNHLIQTSWSSPNRAATLITPLYQLTNAYLQDAECQRLYHRTVMSVLESDASLWSELKDEIATAISNAPTTAIHTWINHYQSIQIDPYQSWLGEKLVDACAVEPDSRTRVDIEKALQQVKTRYRREQFRDLIARGEQMEELNGQLLTTYRTVDVSPQLIADVAHAVNLNMILAPLDQSSFQFKEFDRLYRQGAPVLATLARQSLDMGLTKRRGRATPSDEEKKNSALERIASLERNRFEARLTALGRLAEVTERVDDITYAEALVLANYYLDAHGDREKVRSEQLIPKFVTWPNFGLALSDLLAQRKTDMDQAMTLAQYYSQGNYQMEDVARWQAEIGKLIFDAVVEDRLRSKKQVSEESQRWVFLRNYYVSVIDARLKTVGGRSQSYSDQGQLIPKARQYVKRLVGKTSNGGDFPVERGVKVLQIQSQSELGELVSLNKIAIELLAKQIGARWPTRHAQANALVAQAKSKGRARTVAEELLETEVTLLKLWSLERNAVAERLITR